MEGNVYMMQSSSVLTIYANNLSMAFVTASLDGKAGIAPLSITVNPPQALANLRASLSRSSSYKRQNQTLKHFNT